MIFQLVQEVMRQREAIFKQKKIIWSEEIEKKNRTRQKRNEALNKQENLNFELKRLKQTTAKSVSATVDYRNFSKKKNEILRKFSGETRLLYGILSQRPINFGNSLKKWLHVGIFRKKPRNYESFQRKSTCLWHL